MIQSVNLRDFEERKKCSSLVAYEYALGTTSLRYRCVGYLVGELETMLWSRRWVIIETSLAIGDEPLTCVLVQH